MLMINLNTVINFVCSFTVGYFIGLGILKFGPYLYKGIKSRL
jgi:capsular polysaccharide biosynthesis protein